MDKGFHLDRRIILNAESELKNLYSWSLSEADEFGKTISRHQIPWQWTQRFRATNATLIDRIALEGEDVRGERLAAPVLAETPSIHMDLAPLGCGWRTTKYSMFGSGREIQSFRMIVRQNIDGENESRCEAWGAPSYTYEADFHDETTEDAIIFYVYVKNSTFTRLANRISSSSVTDIEISASDVSGFYSDWSPSISTDHIKVLTRDRDHEVAIPDGCEIVPPRLGYVGELNIYANRKVDFAKNPETAEAESDPIESALPFANEGKLATAPTLLHRSIAPKSLLFSLWAIFAILVIIAVRL